MDFLLIELIKVSITMCIGLFGSFWILSEFLSTNLPIGLSIICIIPVILHLIRIKPLPDNIVENIIGKDPFTIPEDTNLAEDNNKFGYVMRCVGHRGCALDAPENSIPAFNLCAERGCDAVEFDVRMTSDNIPVVFHDDNLLRMADLSLNIKDLTYTELSKVDISIKHPLKEKFKQTQIPTLHQVVTQCLKNKQKMFIEVKENDMRVVSIIVDLYKQIPALHSMAVCTSFYPNLIYMIRRSNPSIVCCLAWRPYFFSHCSFSLANGKGEPYTTNIFKKLFCDVVNFLAEWALPNIVYYILGLSIILLNKEAVSGEMIYKWRSKGIRVIPWTINHPTEKQYYSRNLKLTYLTDTMIGESSAHNGHRKNY